MFAAAPWIAEAIRGGFATEENGAVTLCPEYLETVGYALNADVLMLDFDSEADWLQDSTAYKQDSDLVFDIGSGLGFVLPLDPSILRNTKHMVICQRGIPVTPPVRLDAIPGNMTPPAISGPGFCLFT